jgi:hypothetical protein
MNAARITVGTMLIVGLALSAADAAACGHGAMAMETPMAATMVAPMVGHAMPMPVAVVGLTVGVLPQGFLTVTVNGVPFFRAGPTWYEQFQGPSGPMFRVVPAPHGM